MNFIEIKTLKMLAEMQFEHYLEKQITVEESCAYIFSKYIKQLDIAHLNSTTRYAFVDGKNFLEVETIRKFTEVEINSLYLGDDVYIKIVSEWHVCVSITYIDLEHKYIVGKLDDGLQVVVHTDSLCW